MVQIQSKITANQDSKNQKFESVLKSSLAEKFV